MYLRFPVIADLCGYVLGLSKTELAHELGVAIPTLNAYRVHNRYPREGEASAIGQTTAELLEKAANVLNIPVNANEYIMSSMALDEMLTTWARNNYFQFEMSMLAADVVYYYFTNFYEHYNSPEESDPNISPRELLKFMLTHDIEMLPQIILWILKEYCKSIEIYLVSTLYSRNYFLSPTINYFDTKDIVPARTPLLLKHHSISFYNDKYSLFEKLKESRRDEKGEQKYEHKWLGIPFPYNLDILMLTLKEINFSIETIAPPTIDDVFTSRHKGRIMFPVLKFATIGEPSEEISYNGHKTISY